MLSTEERIKLRNKIAVGTRGEIAVIRDDGSLFFIYSHGELNNAIIDAKYWAHLSSIRINERYVAALHDDGTVCLMDEYGDNVSHLTSSWYKIKEIAATKDQIMGISYDGIVYATNGSINLESLISIGKVEHIYAGRQCVVCLDKEGKAFGIGSGQLPAVISDATRIVDVFCSNCLEDTFALLYDGTLIGNSNVIKKMHVPGEESKPVIQCGITNSGEIIFLNERYGLFIDGKRLTWEVPKTAYGFHDRQEYFEAFSISTGRANAVIAALAHSIAVWGLSLDDKTKKKISRYYIHPATTFGPRRYTEEEIRDITEKKLNVLHAIDALSSVKHAINEREASELAIKISQLEEDTERLFKKMYGVIGFISSLLGTQYYSRKRKEYDRLKTNLDRLYEVHYNLCNWFGPYREKNPEGYSCLGWCSSDPLEFVIWRRHLSVPEKPVRPLGKSSDKEWAKYAWRNEALCIDCVVSHNLYCVVCAEVIDSSSREDRKISRIEKDGYCICSNCISSKQGQYALAGKYVAKCCSCGQKHVPLKLIGNELYCDHCI